MALLWGCNTASPCEVAGGRCTRLDFECGPGKIFAGYDAQCGGNDKCCLPATPSPDAGRPDGG